MKNEEKNPLLIEGQIVSAPDSQLITFHLAEERNAEIFSIGPRLELRFGKDVTPRDMAEGIEKAFEKIIQERLERMRDENSLLFTPGREEG